jgi:hypothetical protein
MHRILFLPDIRPIQKPDTGYPAGYLAGYGLSFKTILNSYHFYLKRVDFIVLSRVVDPDLEPDSDPDWIRIQQLCGSGSVLGIQIPDPDPGARKLRDISVKMHFLVTRYLNKFLPL